LRSDRCPEKQVSLLRIPSTSDRMEEKDYNDLRTAVNLLEKPGVSIRLINLLGYPIERIIKSLPAWIGKVIGYMATRAVGTVFYLALSTMDKKRHGEPFCWSHRAMVFVSGAAGGFFGLPGLIVELPISTALMLRSIADIARSEGEDLSPVDAHLACMTVFALGVRTRSDDAAETAYYAVRAALARALSEAAEFIAQRGIMEEGAPMVIRVIANLASRFGIIVTDKIATEMVPVLGALGGASINLLFISHFQTVARGHFIVRRLEKKYGPESVRREYERLLGVYFASQ
jgi:EcsC protein family